ncbi:MAG: NAD(P)-dependent oxidoreductase [Pseudomonadota bacterium]
MADALKTIGFIGVGAMGAPMAGHLAKAGFDVVARDLSEERLAACLAASGARAIRDAPAFGAASDAVVTMLPNGAAVRAAVLEDGVAEGLRPGALLIDMSSAAPWETQALAEELAPRGVRVLDAPVSGGAPRAISGTLAIIAGGAEADLEAARPALETMGRIAHAGPLGAGQALKALNNLLSAVGLIATFETLIAAAKYGLDPERALAILNDSTGRNNTTENKVAQFVLNRAFDSRFALDLMLKDVTTARAIGERTETPMMLGALAREMLAAAAAELGPGADHTEVARWLETKAGHRLGGDPAG